jgi:NitT/TauT family transport system substrate-binding protein
MGKNLRFPLATRRSLLATFVCLFVAACQPATAIDREPAGGQTLRINVQAGIGYAPLVVMQTRRLLERRVPGVAVEWKAIPTAEAIHEALLSGGLDVATGSPTAFLVARDRGAPVRVLAGLAEVPMGLVTSRTDARSVRDLGPGDRVAVPALGDLEHAVLRMAALRELGDWRALDPLVVEKPHAEAAAALVARREISAHVAVSPFLEEELATPGLRRLVRAADLPGSPLTAVVAYTTPALRDHQPRLFEVFVDVLREASGIVARERSAVARLLTERDGFGLAPSALERSFERSGLVYTTQVRGLSRLATLLELTGQIRSSTRDAGDLAFDGVDTS